MQKLGIQKVLNTEHLHKWWEEIHGHRLHDDMLPPNKFYVVLDEKPVAYFGIHGMECSICYLGFPTISNEIRRKDRKEVYKYMCAFTKEMASQLGYKTVFVSLQSKSAVFNLLGNGFQYGDESKGEADAKHLFMKV